MHTNIGVAIKPYFMSCCRDLFILKCICIFFNHSYHFKSSEYKTENICFLYIWSKMLSSSLSTMLKLSKTTSPKKPFDYDCVTLFIYIGLYLLPPEWIF